MRVKLILQPFFYLNTKFSVEPPDLYLEKFVDIKLEAISILNMIYDCSELGDVTNFNKFKVLGSSYYIESGMLEIDVSTSFMLDRHDIDPDFFEPEHMPTQEEIDQVKKIFLDYNWKECE